MLGQQLDPCAAQQGCQQAGQCCIEGQRGGHHRAGERAVGVDGPLQVMRGASVSEQGALGLSGGAGGVDDIGQVVRAQAGDRRCAGVVQRCIPVRVQRQHADAQHGAAGGQAILQRGAGQHCTRAAVFQQEGQAFAGQLRIQRQIGRTGLEDGEQRHDLIYPARQVQRDPALRSNAQFVQAMGQLVGARLERGVAQLDIAIQQGDGIGRAAHLVFEQVVDARGLRQRSGLCGGEVLQLGAFVGG